MSRFKIFMDAIATGAGTVCGKVIFWAAFIAVAKKMAAKKKSDGKPPQKNDEGKKEADEFNLKIYK